MTSPILSRLQECLALTEAWRDLVKVPGSHPPGITLDAALKARDGWEALVAELKPVGEGQAAPFDRHHLGELMDQHRALERLDILGRRVNHPDLANRVQTALVKVCAWPVLLHGSQGSRAWVSGMDRAMANGNLEVLDVLLRGLTANRLDALLNEPLNSVLRVADGSFSDTPTRWAAWFRSSPVASLERLVEQGADPNADDGNGWPVCCHALGFWADLTRLPALLKLGADPLRWQAGFARCIYVMEGFERGWWSMMASPETADESVRSALERYAADRLRGWPSADLDAALKVRSGPFAAWVRQRVLDDRLAPALPSPSRPRL